MPHLKYPILLMLVISVLVACKSTGPIKDDLTSEEIAQKINPGDQIRFVTKSGDHSTMIVTSVSNGLVTGEENQYRLEDIESIEVIKVNRKETAGLVTGLALGIGFAILLDVLIEAVVKGLIF